MSEDACGHQHPENPQVTCSKPAHPFGAHYNLDTGQVWPGVQMPERRTGKGPKGQRVIDLIHIIEDSGRGLLTGPPTVGKAPMAAMESTWRQTQDQWLRAAKDALHQVCLAHETFTNEAVWALVDDVRERRAMVLVVKHGIRSGWMHEDHAVRVHGEWITRDGHSFPLNKLVPVYRSDIFGA